MKEIELTQGKVAFVDDDLYEELNQHKWFAQKDKKRFYARRASLTINGKRHIIHMHHMIIGKPPRGFETDHRDGDGLRNLRSNLRHVNHRQNCQNFKNRKTSSKYPGICWDKSRGKWMTNIYINGKIKFLGRFTDELEAFEAYKKAVNEIGEQVIDGIACK